MKKLLSIIRKSAVLFPVFIIMIAFHCCYAEIDPILVDKPDPNVFECGENMFIEIPSSAYISYAADKSENADYYLFLHAKILYLEEKEWDGIDKSSFIVRHQGKDGTAESFPLNYMMTARESLVNEWPTMSYPVIFGWLLPLNLIFDVPTMEKDGWTLVFQPAERGGNAVCEVEIPIRIR